MSFPSLRPGSDSRLAHDGCLMEIKHEEGRFYAKTEHGAAELLYRKLSSSRISIYRTFTPPEDRGRGIASQLAEAAFKFAREKKLKVVPDCPYIPEFLEKHSEWRAYATN